MNQAKLVARASPAARVHRRIEVNFFTRHHVMPQPIGSDSSVQILRCARKATLRKILLHVASHYKAGGLIWDPLNNFLRTRVKFIWKSRRFLFFDFRFCALFQRFTSLLASLVACCLFQAFKFLIFLLWFLHSAPFFELLFNPSFFCLSIGLSLSTQHPCLSGRAIVFF